MKLEDLLKKLNYFAEKYKLPDSWKYAVLNQLIKMGKLDKVNTSYLEFYVKNALSQLKNQKVEVKNFNELNKVENKEIITFVHKLKTFKIGGKMELTRLEYNYLKKKLEKDPKDIKEEELKNFPISDAFKERLSKWLKTEKIINETTSDCFGILFDKNDELCQNCNIFQDCEDAKKLFDQSPEIIPVKVVENKVEQGKISKAKERNLKIMNELKRMYPNIQGCQKGVFVRVNKGRFRIYVPEEISKKIKELFGFEPDRICNIGHRFIFTLEDFISRPELTQLIFRFKY